MSLAAALAVVAVVDVVDSAAVALMRHAVILPHPARPRHVQILCVRWVEEGMVYIYVCMYEDFNRSEGV